MKNNNNKQLPFISLPLRFPTYVGMSAISHGVIKKRNTHSFIYISVESFKGVYYIIKVLIGL